MADNLSGLGREVERLVTAPYAPSLQDLHALVQSSSIASLSSWASRKPCQVGVLADILVDGLSRSNFTLDLIRTFARLEPFRNALLERYPYILDQFLQRSENGEPQFISTCVAMLSSPLPPYFIVPARLASFITHLITSIGENPCAETILPLYQLMTGLRTTPRVLLEVPSEIISNLQVELTNTLRNLDDHTGNLLCLATFAQIASSNIPQMNNSPEQRPSWLQNVKHFFGSKRGLKTLDLVVLRVILTCSASCNGLTAEQATESIRLAIEICDIVEPEQRESWIGANSTKIAKLCEKVTRSGIDRGVQILGATFMVSLLPASALPHGIPELALQWLLHKDGDRVLELLPLTYIPRLVEANIVYSGPAVANKLLDYVISSLQPNQAAQTPSINTTQIARSILAGLQGLESQILSSAVAEVAVRQCRENINGLLERSPRRYSVTTCRDFDTCQASVVQLENGLLNDLFSFYFRSALMMKSSGQFDYANEMSTFGLFISRSNEAVPGIRCQFWETKPLEFQNAFSSLKIHDQSPSPRQDWRTGIAKTLEWNSRMGYDNMMQKIEEICYDLENRCNGVEAPLRAVEDERNRLLKEAEELNSHNKKLYSELKQASGTTYSLQQDIFRLESQAETASSRIDQLSASLEVARKDLNDQRLESQESANSEREQARSRELELIASSTEMEEKLDDLQEKIVMQREENDSLREELNMMGEERSAYSKVNDSLEQQLLDLEREFEAQMEETHRHLDQQSDRIDQLLADQSEAGSREEGLQAKLSEEELESDRLKTALQQLVESHKTEVNTLQEHFETQVSKMTAESEKQRDEIASLQADMQASASSATKELHARDKRIQYLEKKIQHMRDERAAKAREFSEAQQHIGRLMSVMGFKPEPANSKPPGKQQRSRPTPGPSQVATEEMQTHSPGEDTQSQQGRQMAESFDLTATPTPPGERSPKRSRDYAFALTESPTASHTSGKKSRESVSRRGTQHSRDRKVLEDATQNSQPITQASSIPCSSQRDSFQEGQVGGVDDENHLREIDLDMDMEFSKDFLFTSTSVSEANYHRPLLGTQR
ncbi:uncharacterized protein KD926_009924 [Aspergillus affinis]|uniref:uncharacterized protein n=1 Tax=Aspergillus affinis TaxID=1070780 RepID=UPI0022FED889|nr:uncharacterized protein KD926_009924 [Aspergillus affinis]KAI9039174.1 hypothetical protein KD926_009924 [Aspergillus affinis]